MAIATSMATIMFTSISSVRAHHKRGAVRWDIAQLSGPGHRVRARWSPASGVFAILKGGSLALLFAAFVSFSATQMLLDKKPEARAPARYSRSARRGCSDRLSFFRVWSVRAAASSPCRS
ncbi:MAG: sulfite exporter TauE/SafE family protein [Rhizobium sp.]|nr:sulfite exporter TauE/SafE family protein [Rhizobium sp.]